MRYKGLFVAAAVGAAVLAGTPAQADPMLPTPTPVVDLSVCTADPVWCAISGALLGLTEVMIGNTMAVITYGLCLGPVEPGHGAILPPVIYDFRPWCPPGA